ncbi:MAG: TAXI family TRAP transporter solute-binding subunit [Zavarzinia sp.]|nr:TAXI family TRAP transporter solute-binding subunit [Zavarzinia sp.]
MRTRDIFVFDRRDVLRAGAGLAAVGAFGIGRARAETFVNVLTGGTSGAYYPIGVALGGVIEKTVEGVKTSVQATKASVENLNLLQKGQGEIGFTLADAASAAVAGNADAGFKAPLDKLRLISGIYSNYVQIVANAESGIASLADLKGKRISVGAPKSGTELNARAILGAAGITYDDFAKVEYLPFGESVDLMKNRQIDVTLQSAGLGVGSIKDLAASIKITIVPVPADIVAKVGDAAYQAGEIPAGTYTGQDVAVPTASIRNLLVSHDGVTEDLAYGMTKALFDNLDTLAAAHAAARGIKLEASAAQGPVPIHPGALRFFKEKGLA